MVTALMETKLPPLRASGTDTVLPSGRRSAYAWYNNVCLPILMAIIALLSPARFELLCVHVKTLVVGQSMVCSIFSCDGGYTLVLKDCR